MERINRGFRMYVNNLSSCHRSNHSWSSLLRVFDESLRIHRPSIILYPIYHLKPFSASSPFTLTIPSVASTHKHPSHTMTNPVYNSTFYHIYNFSLLKFFSVSFTLIRRISSFFNFSCHDIFTIRHHTHVSKDSMPFGPSVSVSTFLLHRALYITTNILQVFPQVQIQFTT